MIKREQEFYNSLKSRSYDNTWGGRDGLRNTWILSMKEDFDNLYTLRDGILTLEQAFHDLCGGVTSIESKTEDDETNSAKEILEDDTLRCDIELESLGLAIGGLWHCKESREIFREIISTSTSIGIFALGLDLLCRNCQAYLEATKPTITRKAVSSVSNYDQGMYTNSGRLTRSAFSTDQPQQPSSRRMNSWQQQQSM